MKKVYYTKEFDFGHSTKLVCCICGTTNRRRLVVETLGISAGMRGKEYSFCKECWFSPDLGKSLLNLLGFRNGMKLKNDSVEVREESR